MQSQDDLVAFCFFKSILNHQNNENLNFDLKLFIWTENVTFGIMIRA